MTSFANIFYRDESSPRSLDPELCDSSDKRTPSARALRLMRRNGIKAQQAERSINATVSATFPGELAQSHDDFDALHDSTDTSVVDKSFGHNKPSPQPHSQSLVDQSTSSSADQFVIESSAICDDVVVPASGKYIHASRDSNLTDFEQDQRLKINFPKSGDSTTWKEVDQELAIALPVVFSQQYLDSHSTTEISKSFDTFLYDFFAKHFGTVESNRSPVPRKAFRHRGLERLRKAKNSCKKAFKALLKAGLANSDAGKVLKLRWQSLLRKHNRLRLGVHKKKNAKDKIRAESNFKKDPHGFASKLFHDSKSEKPTFTKETAVKYFASTYRDEGRGESYEPPPDLPRPDTPAKFFNEHCPSLRELERSVRKKSNGAAAGLNGLTYVPYKKCRSILETLHRIIKKIWTSKVIPEDWAQAFVVLLSKSDVLSDPSEFRPIAITNTCGKVFFSVVSDRLQTFLVSNNYIKRATQKGFLSGVAGCVEHSFTLFEALRNAKTHQRQIVVAWIDLANAYGSVRHNLIQFALSWYHVPDHIQHLIFDYYNKLMAKIQTPDWSTGFFLFDIGLFQGCVLSTILFDAVFQLLLDMLDPINNSDGYTFYGLEYTKLTKAYADDLALAAKSTNCLQKACAIVDKFLSWTKTMRAKPKKCVAVGFRKFDPRSDSGRFQPLTSTIYSPFDPGIIISGKRMKFIFDPSHTSDPAISLKRDHFKFLGRWISIELNESKVKIFILAQFRKELKLINKSKVNGIMKLWLYQHYLLAHLAWPFLIHDFNISFAVELEKLISTTLKQWAGIYRGADIGSLFRSRDKFGLGLTSISQFFCKMQLIKCSLLQNSGDPNVRLVFEFRSRRKASWRIKWSAEKLFHELSADVLLQTRFPSQNSRLGLGHDVFDGQPSESEIRKLITSTATKAEQDRLFAHSVSLSRQGRWTVWLEEVIPFDLSWKNLIYGPGPRVLSFVLNATINSVCSPDMLKLWGYKSSAKCSLCRKDPCTLHHILAGCKVALSQQRYTWRHDSILLCLKDTLHSFINHHNESRIKISKPKPISFVKKGFKGCSNRSSAINSPSVLEGFSDWRVLVDFTKNKIIFPPEIYSTSERPDIIIYSKSAHKVLLVELTSPAEEGIEAAKLRKQARYTPLLAAINDDKNSPWSAHLFTIESGARGFVAHSTFRFLRRIGLSPSRARSTCKDISLITARCSYAIFLARNATNWDSNRELLSLSSKVEAPSVVPHPVSAMAASKNPCKHRLPGSKKWCEIPPPVEFYNQPPGDYISPTLDQFVDVIPSDAELELRFQKLDPDPPICISDACLKHPLHLQIPVDEFGLPIVNRFFSFPPRVAIETPTTQCAQDTDSSDSEELKLLKIMMSL